jgi:signal transduction histidine kinase/ActR/RegA family two-component response regulator
MMSNEQMLDSNRARVLVHAPIGRDGSASAELIQRVGLTAEVCATLPRMMKCLEEGAAAIFIAEEGLFGVDISDLSRWVEQQQPWSDLPFVILTSQQEQPAVARWRQSLVAALRNVSLLERPVQAITLTSSIQAAVRARLRQYEVRELLEARERAAHELEALVIARTRALHEANSALVTQMSERARVEEVLRQAQKMEAIGQLTGGVAHDFNNLLMVIQGGLDLLHRHSTDPSGPKRIIERMQQAAQRGAGLTRQLLAFSRHQPLTPEPVDLIRQIGGMRELLDRSLRGDVTVKLELARDLWPVEVDPGELELVILNLAVNARDAMPNGGTIRLRAENVAAETVDGHLGDWVRLSVVDDGTGISPEITARVFEPFFTTKEIGKGSGLGLAQVYGFVRQSGGTVQIDSEVGSGTSVILTLPRSTGIPVMEPPRVVDLGSGPHACGSNGRVLLIDDDDEVAALVSEMLDQLGYEVTRVASAAAALGALANGRQIDLVFSDIMMPGGMDGVGLARELRQRRKGLPVLLTSGYAEAAKRAAESEGVRVLPKPYRLDELASALRLTIRPAGNGAALQ